MAFLWEQYYATICDIFKQADDKSHQLCALASTRPRPGGRVREKHANGGVAQDTWIDALQKPSTEIFLECYCVTPNEPIKHKIIERYYWGVCSTWSLVKIWTRLPIHNLLSFLVWQYLELFIITWFQSRMAWWMVIPSLSVFWRSDHPTRSGYHRSRTRYEYQSHGKGSWRTQSEIREQWNELRNQSKAAY